MSQRNAFHELNPNAGSFPVFPSFGLRQLTVRIFTVNASSENTGIERAPIVERIVIGDWQMAITGGYYLAI